jgi:hypothetical protein
VADRASTKRKTRHDHCLLRTGVPGKGGVKFRVWWADLPGSDAGDACIVLENIKRAANVQNQDRIAAFKEPLWIQRVRVGEDLCEPHGSGDWPAPCMIDAHPP